MSICKKCGKENEAEASVCAYCNESLTAENELKDHSDAIQTAVKHREDKIRHEYHKNLVYLLLACILSLGVMIIDFILLTVTKNKLFLYINFADLAFFIITYILFAFVKRLIFCPFCGSPLIIHKHKCRKCGKKID